MISAGCRRECGQRGVQPLHEAGPERSRRHVRQCKHASSPSWDAREVRVHVLPCGQHAPRSAPPAALRQRFRHALRYLMSPARESSRELGRACQALEAGARSRVRSVVGSRRALLAAASGGSKRLAGRAFWGRERVPREHVRAANPFEALPAPMDSSYNSSVTKGPVVFRTALFMVVGATLGLAYSRFVGCRHGHCPLTSNQYIATVYGAVLGLLLSQP
jgi:hypothetical protein